MFNYGVGDKVKLGPIETLTHACWKGQEVGIGVITRTSGEFGEFGRYWFHVTWEDDSANCYHERDLVLIQPRPEY